jgi:ABC-2 type transport system ATP-binding protein
MTENNIAVKIDHVSKSFRLPTEASTSLRTTMVNYSGIKGYKEQHILKDISFDVKGDFLGLLVRMVWKINAFKNYFSNLRT